MESLKLSSLQGNHCPESPGWDEYDGTPGALGPHEPDEGFDKIDASFSYHNVIYVRLRLCKNCGCFYGDAPEG